MMNLNKLAFHSLNSFNRVAMSIFFFLFPSLYFHFENADQIKELFKTTTNRKEVQIMK